MMGGGEEWKSLGATAKAFHNAAVVLFDAAVHNRDNPPMLRPPTDRSGWLALTTGCNAAFAVELGLKAVAGNAGGSRDEFDEFQGQTAESGESKGGRKRHAGQSHSLKALWAYAKHRDPDGTEEVAQAWKDREGGTRAWDRLKDVDGLLKEHDLEFVQSRFFGEKTTTKAGKGQPTITARQAAECEGLLVLSELLVRYLDVKYGIQGIDGPYDWPEINLKEGRVARRGMRRMFGRDHKEMDRAIEEAQKRRNVEDSVLKIRTRLFEIFCQREEAEGRMEAWDENEEQGAWEAGVREAAGEWRVDISKHGDERRSHENQWEAKDAETALRVVERAVTEHGVKQGKQEPGGHWLTLNPRKRQMEYRLVEIDRRNLDGTGPEKKLVKGIATSGRAEDGPWEWKLAEPRTNGEEQEGTAPNEETALMRLLVEAHAWNSREREQRRVRVVEDWTRENPTLGDGFPRVCFTHPHDPEKGKGTLHVWWTRHQQLGQPTEGDFPDAQVHDYIDQRNRQRRH